MSVRIADRSPRLVVRKGLHRCARHRTARLQIDDPADDHGAGLDRDADRPLLTRGDTDGAQSAAELRATVSPNVVFTLRQAAGSKTPRRMVDADPVPDGVVKPKLVMRRRRRKRRLWSARKDRELPGRSDFKTDLRSI